MSATTSEKRSKVTIIYWRDIPAQVTARVGRKNVQKELSPRFMAAIDEAAMKSGATNSDAYLEGWRKITTVDPSENLDLIVENTTVQIEKYFNKGRIKKLIESGGYAEK